MRPELSHLVIVWFHFTMSLFTIQRPWNIAYLAKSLHGVTCFMRTSSGRQLQRDFSFFQSSSSLRNVSTIGRPKGRLVILGSGWGGYNILRNINKSSYDVAIVSPRNYFLFTPLLAGSAVGTLEFRSILEPVRSYHKDVDYFMAWCNKINFASKTLDLESNLHVTKGQKFSLSYDKLVIAVGAYSNTFGIPGVKEHGLFLKDVEDARKIRMRVLECFDHASQPGISEEEQLNLLHFAVVGGGPTGIEFSAELYDFISEDLSRLYPSLIDKVQLTVYDVAPNVLASFDKTLASYAVQKFERKGVQIKTEKHVYEVTEKHLKIKEDGDVPYGMLVWATGLMQNPLVKSMGSVAKDFRNERIMTDQYLRVVDKETLIPIPNIYALGDCATIKDYELPATAQVANQKAFYLAKHLGKNNTEILDAKTPPFTFKSRGTMAYIGNWEAVVDMTNINKEAKEAGRLAWFFWRSAYLTMAVSTRNKLLIPMYWFLTWLFGRDVTRF